MKNIRRISFEDIKNYKKEAEKVGLTFCNSTVLFGLFDDNDNLLAFTGIIFKSNKAIFKNHYVPESNRGKGYFKLLFRYSICLVKGMKYKTVEATCTKMSIRHYLENGFKVIKEYKQYTKVRNENI